MCGYCWGKSYVEGNGHPLPNSTLATFERETFAKPRVYKDPEDGLWTVEDPSKPGVSVGGPDWCDALEYASAVAAHAPGTMMNLSDV